MFGKHMPRTLLISSASLVTIAFAGIASQTIDWQELGKKLTSPAEEAGRMTIAGERDDDASVSTTQRRKQEESHSVIADISRPAAAPQPAPAPAPVPAFQDRLMIGSEAATGGLMSLSSGSGGSAPRKVAQSEPPAMPAVQPADRERFASAEVNPLKRTSAEPVSTFSVDVDTASYSYVRSTLSGGRLPNPDAVRVEEMVNYFDYSYPVPEKGGHPFSTNVSVIDTPWNEHTRLMQVGIQGHKVPLDDLPPQNLVFLIDTSGSMADANKLPLLQQSFRLLLSTLRDEDEVAIVTYAGSSGVLLEPTKVTDKSRILEKINALTSGGSTAGHEGLKGAYALAETMTGDGEQTRIILATDGDFNVGLSDPDSLKRYVTEQQENGTALSVLGFGRGNYNDELMQTLAQNGQGVAAYIDTLSEARKVLVDQVVSSISMIAQDVKIQVEFNPDTVAEYRLIGYETRALRTEDFRNDKVDAGDIGAGHNVTALYEITPVGSPAEKFSDLRYGPKEKIEPVRTSYSGELAFVKLRYKLPGDKESTLIETPVMADTSGIPMSETLFAASVAAFGQKLKGTDHLGDWDFKAIEKLASENKGADRFGYRSEFLTLVRLADVAER
ncbi:von Willebrand factor, type A [Labrenzia sp. C1B10]|uniref:vWA domain-containing protein n=1 Tax=unclassified Labrenzia TaxID=2648686 RepID=UPI0003B8079E|nr:MULTISPECIES: VWA domain-containing protein [unclassified Labrenzia]ERP93556.1 von Willebrand factor, type A [Labrenzia sp. C1B10]ERS05619.1 von Willebrand factor, type A [Labrenzia sp. C1B70]